MPAQRPHACALVATFAIVLLALGVAPTSRVTSALAQPAPPPVPPTIERDVVYGSSGGAPLLLDVYRPTGAPIGAPLPTVLLVHGGGWLAGSKAAVEREGVALSAKGFISFGIEYDMKTLPHWPIELENIQLSLRWVQDNAAKYGVDVHRIGVFGGSAGGNLAMLLGTDGPGVAGYQPVKAVVSWSGPADLRTLAVTVMTKGMVTRASSLPDEARPVSCDDNPNCFAMLVPDLLIEYLSCGYNRCPFTYRAASPAAKVSSATPPMYLAGSQQDFVPMDQNFLMANALNNNGVRSVIQYVEGNRHADAYFDLAIDPSIEFLAAELTPGTNPKITPRSPPTTIAGSAELPPLIDGWELPAPSPPPPWLLVAGIGAGLLLLGLTTMGLRRRRHRSRSDV